MKDENGTKGTPPYSAGRKVAARRLDVFVTMVARIWTHCNKPSLTAAYAQSCRAWKVVGRGDVPLTLDQIRYRFRKWFGGDRAKARRVLA